MKGLINCEDGQADLGLYCPHMAEDTFSHGADLMTNRYTVFTITLNRPSKICSRQHSIFTFLLAEKISSDITCESSACQMIHMKCQDLFSLIF